MHFLTFRSLLCGETSQAIILSFATPVKTAGATANGMTATTPDVSITSSMATSTPIKFLESPHRNQSMSGASSWPGARSASPVSMTMMSSSPGSSAGATPDNASEPKRPRAGSLIDSIAPSARIVLEVSEVLVYMRKFIPPSCTILCDFHFAIIWKMSQFG